MASTGNGGAGPLGGAKVATADVSRRSTQHDRRRTGTTAELTLDQALEILQQSLLEYQKAGGSVDVLAIKKTGMLAIVLADCYYCQQCGNICSGDRCVYGCSSCDE